MKKQLFISFFIIGSLFRAMANVPVAAYVMQAAFDVPGKSPYVETYLTVIGNSVKFTLNSNGKYQGAVDIAISFAQNNEIKTALKYTLSSPEISDTLHGTPNFIDQHRYPLANGAYTMEITISDKNQPGGNPLTTKVLVTIDFASDKAVISDVQLLESYTKSTSQSIITKSGYDLIPYVSTYYPENINKIKFYAELYNAKKTAGDGEKMLVTYYIESYESKKKLNDYSSFSKQTAGEVNVLLSELNIAALPSGNYNLVIELRDKENKLLAIKTCFFQRQNKQAELSFDDLKAIDVSNTFVKKYKSVDTMYSYIACLRPICSKAEIQYCENQLQGKNLEQMQQFFYNFWNSRHPDNPEKAWLEYNKEVQKVNKEFGTFGLKGYDTDRGRVYLQYGSPTLRNIENREPSAYPYEMWEYDALVDKTQELTNPYNKQSNKQFIFYNPDLVSNRFILIHSTAKGEIVNTRWDLLLHKRDTQSRNLDDEKASEHLGGNTDENFKNPR